MTEKVLFILAAMSGVGKSTLLTNALRFRVPLFGDTYNDQFQATNIPSRYPEDSIAVEERILNKTWFSGMHIDFFSKSDGIPTNFVMHLDLFSISIILSKLYRHSKYKEHCDMKALIDRTPQNIIFNNHNQAVNDSLLSLPFFTSFDCILINTLYAPFEVARKQWNNSQK